MLLHAATEPFHNDVVLHPSRRPFIIFVALVWPTWNIFYFVKVAHGAQFIADTQKQYFFSFRSNYYTLRKKNNILIFLLKCCVKVENWTHTSPDNALYP